jgi:hypothetical protein
VDVLLLMPRAWSTVEEMWDGAQCDLVACISAKIARVCATEHADIEESWSRLHQALERCRFAEERALT